MMTTMTLENHSDTTKIRGIFGIQADQIKREHTLAHSKILRQVDNECASREAAALPQRFLMRSVTYSNPTKYGDSDM